MSTPNDQSHANSHFFKGKTPRNALMGGVFVIAIVIAGLGGYYEVKQEAAATAERAAKQDKQAEYGHVQEGTAGTGVDSLINAQVGDAKEKAQKAMRPTAPDVTPESDNFDRAGNGNSTSNGSRTSGGSNNGGDVDGIYTAGIFKSGGHQINAGKNPLSQIAASVNGNNPIESGYTPDQAAQARDADTKNQLNAVNTGTAGQVEALEEKLNASQNGGTGAAASQQSDLSFLHQAKTYSQSGEGFSTASFVGQEKMCTLAPPNHIPVLTREGLNSDRPGTAALVVTDDVYDSVTGTCLLIPKGSTIVAPYSSDIRVGAESILVAATELRLPNGKEVPLNGAEGADQNGYAGFSGDVNNHFLKIFGTSFLTAILVGVFDKSSTTTTTTSPYGVQEVGQTAGQIAAQTSQSVLSRYQNIPPTITVDPGTRFMVKVNQDIHLEPYRD